MSQGVPTRDCHSGLIRLSTSSSLEFQQVGDRGNDERSLLVNMSDVEMLTS